MVVYWRVEGVRGGTEEEERGLERREQGKRLRREVCVTLPPVPVETSETAEKKKIQRPKS
jgi:hypothetical protein